MEQGLPSEFPFGENRQLMSYIKIKSHIISDQQWPWYETLWCLPPSGIILKGSMITVVLILALYFEF